MVRLCGEAILREGSLIKPRKGQPVIHANTIGCSFVVACRVLGEAKSTEPEWRPARVIQVSVL